MHRDTEDSRYSQYSVIYPQQFRVFAGEGAGESGFLHKKRVPLHSFLPPLVRASGFPKLLLPRQSYPAG